MLTDRNGFRIIGFGRFAGLVGAYNGLRALGLRNRIFELKPAHQCEGLEEMLHQLTEINLPPTKIALTGDGRVAAGAVEVLDFMKIQRLSPEDFLETEKPSQPVYTQLLPGDYAKRKDGNIFDLMHFLITRKCMRMHFYPLHVPLTL